jgi:hypothetical protein
MLSEQEYKILETLLNIISYNNFDHKVVKFDNVCDLLKTFIVNKVGDDPKNTPISGG